MGITAMNEFKDQLDATEKEKLTKHITELREIKGQAGDAASTCATPCTLLHAIQGHQHALPLLLCPPIPATCHPTSPMHPPLHTQAEGMGYARTWREKGAQSRGGVQGSSAALGEGQRAEPRITRGDVNK
jgi:hypothetical protein